MKILSGLKYLQRKLRFFFVYKTYLKKKIKNFFKRKCFKKKVPSRESCLSSEVLCVKIGSISTYIGLIRGKKNLNFTTISHFSLPSELKKSYVLVKKSCRRHDCVNSSFSYLCKAWIIVKREHNCRYVIFQLFSVFQMLQRTHLEAQVEESFHIKVKKGFHYTFCYFHIERNIFYFYFITFLYVSYRVKINIKTL